MAHIVFYTKPGCNGGARQKQLLEQSGHVVEERSILGAQWTPESLKPYFTGKEIKDWFNPNAPQVKSGAVIPGSLSEAATLEQLCQNPILIKRPLMQTAELSLSGFDQELLRSTIGLQEIPGDYNLGCQSSGAAAHACNHTRA